MITYMWNYLKNKLPELNSWVNVFMLDNDGVPTYNIKRCKYIYDEFLQENVFIDQNIIYNVFAWTTEDNPDYLELDFEELNDKFYEVTTQAYKSNTEKKQIFSLSLTPSLYLHNWKNKQDVVKSFELNELDDIHILFASYGTDNYVGDAFVLFIKDNLLYEVNGSHCSCFGLEGQWKPEKTSIAALLFRLNNGNFGNDEWSGNVFKTELLGFLKN